MLAGSRLHDEQRIEQAKRWAAYKGYTGHWTQARKTVKGSISAGTAILWKPFLQVKPRYLTGLEHRATLVSVRVHSIGELWIACLYGDAHSNQAAKDQLLKLWSQIKHKEFWVILGDLNLEADEVREWMTIAAPGAMTLDVGPTCFGGCRRRWILESSPSQPGS